MLLAPLIPVAGLDGGADGGPDGGPVAESIDAALRSVEASSPIVGALPVGDALPDGY